MKKLILLAALFLISGMIVGQTIGKGTFIGTHVITITLKPGVTMEQFIEFYTSRYIPEANKNITGWKTYLLKGIRGENPESYGILYVVDSEQDRDKYINPDGSWTELAKTTNEKMKPVMDELEKLGSFTSKFTDWLVL